MRSAAWYSRFAKAAAHFCGRPRVFTLAVAIIGVWIITGPIFGFSDTWQLVINTGMTIITSLMVLVPPAVEHAQVEISRSQLRFPNSSVARL